MLFHFCWQSERSQSPTTKPTSFRLFTDPLMCLDDDFITLNTFFFSSALWEEFIDNWWISPQRHMNVELICLRCWSHEQSHCLWLETSWCLFVTSLPCFFQAVPVETVACVSMSRRLITTVVAPWDISVVTAPDLTPAPRLLVKTTGFVATSAISYTHVAVPQVTMDTIVRTITLATMTPVSLGACVTV